MKKFMRRFHKWLGLPGAVIFLYMSFTGILLNHPDLIAPINAPEALLPDDMKMRDWGRGGAQVFCALPDGSVLFGGKIGLHRVDLTTGEVEDVGFGVPNSVGRGEVTALLSRGDRVFAGTVSGLYEASFPEFKWEQRLKGVSIRAITDLDGFISLFSQTSRFHKDGEVWIEDVITAEKGKNSLSKTELVFGLHSGKLFGTPGRLFIDLTGLALMILSLSGILITFYPKIRKHLSSNGKRGAVKLIQYHLYHYRRFGWVLFIPMLMLPITGFFMRPPFSQLLRGGKGVAPSTGITAISGATVVEGKLVLWDRSRLYSLSNYRGATPTPITGRLPVHPMGIYGVIAGDGDTLLVGSFSGVIKGVPSKGEWLDYNTGEVATPWRGTSSDSGWQVRSLSTLWDQPVVTDFRRGPHLLKSGELLSPMPEIYRRRSTFTLWNYLFEIHNGRILRSFIGQWSWLHNPVVAIVSLLTLLSGVPLVIRHKKRKS